MALEEVEGEVGLESMRKNPRQPANHGDLQQRKTGEYREKMMGAAEESKKQRVRISNKPNTTSQS